MKKQIIISIAALLMAGAAQLSAQGIVVYKTDGTKVYFPAEQVEKVATYDYGEEPEPEPGPGGEGTTTYTANGVSFTMVGVEGGTFQMGSTDGDSDEMPVHQVSVSSFSIGQTEVTQELWEAVMGTNPSYFKGLKLPVERVSWNDCQTFITKLNQLTGKTFRLPTEAEWEFAARGGNSSKGYTYAGSNTIDVVAWYTFNSSDKTHEVATKQANELGIYDMSGNVCEWCEDIYAPYQAAPQTNPRGAAEGGYHLARGGGWNRGPHMCKVTDRGNYRPEYASNAVGLRLVMDGES